MATSSNSGYSYPPEKAELRGSAHVSTQDVGSSQGTAWGQDVDPNMPPPPPYEEHFHHSPPSSSSAYKSYPSAEDTNHHKGKQLEGASTASPYAPTPPNFGTSEDTSDFHTPSRSSTSLSHSLTPVRGKSDKPRSVLDPPPPSFQRAPPKDLPFTPFDPTALRSCSSQLEKGFSPRAPHYASSPHPFAAHDVNEVDWLSFLDDVKTAACIAPISKIVTGIAPAARMVPLPLTNMLISKGIEMHMKNRKNGPVGEVIDHWNHYFFHRRLMHVVLAQGKISYSGPEAPPPDMVQSNFRQGSPSGVRFLDDEDEDEDETSTDDSASVIIEGAMEKRRTLKEAYKHQQQRRRDWSRSTGKKWRLVISCKDYVL